MSQIFQKPPFNYTYKVGIANAVDYENIAVSLVGPQVQSPLQDLIVPINTLVRDGQTLIVNASGEKIGAAGSANFFITVNGIQIANLASQVGIGAGGYSIEAIIKRQNSTTLISSITGYFAMTLGSGASIATPTFRNAWRSFNVNPELQLEIDFVVDISAGDTVRQDFCSVFVI